jgi:hypothetical protein
MSCQALRACFSALRDADLPPDRMLAALRHIDECRDCAREWEAFRGSLDLLADLPRPQTRGALAARVRDRLEIERRGPGLTLLLRPRSAIRPLILPSLVPAALVLVTVLAAALGLERAPAVGRVASSPGDWTGVALDEPLFSFTGVTVPQARSRDLADLLQAEKGEVDLFLETVVERDGRVSTVRLLGGDEERARPIVEALRKERFEPGRFKGRPVAVSVYRIISRLDVLPAT